LIVAVAQPLRDLVEETVVVQAFLDQGLSVPPALKAMNWKRRAEETAPSEQPSPRENPWKRPRS
jgi:hypothetical protein